MRHASQASKRKSSRYNRDDRVERRCGRYHKEHYGVHASTVWNGGRRRRDRADGSRYGEHCNPLDANVLQRFVRSNASEATRSRRSVGSDAQPSAPFLTNWRAMSRDLLACLI
jgi:hypothetical protein